MKKGMGNMKKTAMAPRPPKKDPKKGKGEKSGKC